MPIEFISEDADFQLDKENIYKDWLTKVLVSHNKKLGVIRYWFVDETEILRINNEYLNHNYFTDIISFDSSFLNELNGEIYICPEVVKLNAINFSFGDFERELARVIVHGVLHLCGFEDHSEEQKKEMRSQEDLALELADFTSF